MTHLNNQEILHETNLQFFSIEEGTAWVCIHSGCQVSWVRCLNSPRPHPSQRPPIAPLSVPRTFRSEAPGTFPGNHASPLPLLLRPLHPLLLHVGSLLSRLHGSPLTTQGLSPSPPAQEALRAHLCLPTLPYHDCLHMLCPSPLKISSTEFSRIRPTKPGVTWNSAIH